MKRQLARAGAALLVLGALFAAGNAVGFLATDLVGGRGFKANLLALPLLGWLHGLGGAVAIVSGALLAALLRRGSFAHRLTGRVYVLAVLAAALPTPAFWAAGASGAASSSAFAVLAVAWVAATALGWRAACRGQIEAHRRWMRRSYAMTFSALTLRVLLGLQLLAGVRFTTAFAVAAWACWLLNLALLELWLRHEARARMAATASATRLRG